MLIGHHDDLSRVSLYEDNIQVNKRIIRPDTKSCFHQTEKKDTLVFLSCCILTTIAKVLKV